MLSIFIQLARRRTVRVAMTGALAVGLVGGGFAWAQDTDVTAELMTANGTVVGVATFTEVAGGVQVTGAFQGLPAGEHGIHIHAVGQCDPPDFTSAGGHFNPTGALHGLENPAGPHVGDLPNLIVGSDGTGDINALASGATLGGGPSSLFDADGSALVIHANPDDQVTDPAGNSGPRIACGVITRPAATIAIGPGPGGAAPAQAPRAPATTAPVSGGEGVADGEGLDTLPSDAE